MAFTETDLNSAYSATKSLGSPIGRNDTDAGKLTLEQAAALTNWVDWQTCSTFEDKNGKSFPIQAVLDLWHASIVYEDFESWFSEEPKNARKAYAAICCKHKIQHGA
jgi:hypothetical protein